MSRRGKTKRRPWGDRSAGRWKRLLLLAGAVVAVPLVAIGTFVLLSPSGGPSGPPRAAIVDQLGATFPNPTLVDSATELLEQAGYLVDYHPGEEVTVDFYRDLPTHGYDLVLIRTHSARTVTAGPYYDHPTLFTSEPYSATRYVSERRAAQVGQGEYLTQGGPEYFSITPAFVRAGMRGRFDDATVLIMGCYSLGTDALAEVFVERGADAVVGWSGYLSASHMDEATERLLQHIVADGLSAEEAVELTMEEVGTDPSYRSTLRVYPSEG